MDFRSMALGRVGSVFGHVLGDDPYGGGGAGGRFVFADLAQLDAVRQQWEGERKKIQARADKIKDAIKLATRPADDPMSVRQVEAFQRSLYQLKDYNDALFDYAEGYVQRLDLARTEYAETEEANRVRMAHLRSGG